MSRRNPLLAGRTRVRPCRWRSLLRSASAATSYHVTANWPKPTWLFGPVPSPTSGNVPSAASNGSGVGSAVAADGTTYVCDTYRSQVLKYNADGDLVTTWTGAGNPGGAFSKPQGIALNADGSQVYIADTGNHRVQRYSSSGTYLGHWGKQGGPDFSGVGPGEFKAPEGVAVAANGDVTSPTRERPGSEVQRRRQRGQRRLGESRQRSQAVLGAFRRRRCRGRDVLGPGPLERQLPRSASECGGRVPRAVRRVRWHLPRPGQVQEAGRYHDRYSRLHLDQ